MATDAVADLTQVFAAHDFWRQIFAVHVVEKVRARNSSTKNKVPL
mgnify:CR=1 FL=1